MFNRFDGLSRDNFQTKPEGESMTKQGNAYDADVNVIIGKYIKTGDLSLFNARVGQYGDVSDIGDYATALERIKFAEESFSLLPAKVRDMFANDPANLADALGRADRRPELIAAGIVEAPPVSAPSVPEASAAKPPTL